MHNNKFTQQTYINEQETSHSARGIAWNIDKSIYLATLPFAPLLSFCSSFSPSFPSFIHLWIRWPLLHHFRTNLPLFTLLPSFIPSRSPALLFPFLNHSFHLFYFQSYCTPTPLSKWLICSFWGWRLGFDPRGNQTKWVSGGLYRRTCSTISTLRSKHYTTILSLPLLLLLFCYIISFTSIAYFLFYSFLYSILSLPFYSFPIPFFISCSFRLSYCFISYCVSYFMLSSKVSYSILSASTLLAFPRKSSCFSLFKETHSLLPRAHVIHDVRWCFGIQESIHFKASDINVLFTCRSSTDARCTCNMGWMWVLVWTL